MSVAYGDGYLWVQHDNSTIGKVDPSTGDLVSSVSPIGGSVILHIAYGGGFLWIVDNSHCARVKKVNPASGAVLQSFVLSSTNCISALTYGGGYVWAAGPGGSRIISKVDPTTGAVAGTIDLGVGWPITLLAYEEGSAAPTLMTISAARTASPGIQVRVESAIVTAVFAGQAYIESAGRSAGMRIVGDLLPPYGKIVDIEGEIEMSAGEKSIRVSAFSVVGPGGVDPLGMSVRSMAIYGPNAGVASSLGTAGLCSAGLLVRTWGEVTARATGFFYLDDGSFLQDGTGNNGLRVVCDSMTPPALYKRVQVTGISTLFLNGSTYLPALRLRDSDDLKSLD
jgi:hypothetical protein